MPILLIHKGSSQFYVINFLRKNGIPTQQRLHQIQQRQQTQHKYSSTISDTRMYDLDYYLWIDEKFIDQLKETDESVDDFSKKLCKLKDNFVKNVFGFISKCLDQIETDLYDTLITKCYNDHIEKHIMLGKYPSSIREIDISSIPSKPSIREFSKYTLDSYCELPIAILGQYKTDQIQLSSDSDSFFDRLFLAASTRYTRLSKKLLKSDSSGPHFAPNPFLYRINLERYQKTSRTTYLKHLRSTLIEIDVGYLQTIPIDPIDPKNSLRKYLDSPDELLFPFFSTEYVICEKLKYLFIYLDLLDKHDKSDSDVKLFEPIIHKLLKSLLNYYLIACSDQGKYPHPMSFIRWLFKYKESISSKDFKYQRQEYKHLVQIDPSITLDYMNSLLEPYIGMFLVQT